MGGGALPSVLSCFGDTTLIKTLLALAYYPAYSYLYEWFVRRRGMAVGILFAGGA